MTRLTRDEVLHIAKLAKLSLTESEVKRFQRQLSEVLSYISELSAVDTSKVEPTSQTTGLENVKRLDQVKNESLTKDEALSGTEKTYSDYFVVPAIFENKDE